jgi:putative Ca2+/H+ antiporter (TMEM165/GDT1 family)
MHLAEASSVPAIFWGDRMAKRFSVQLVHGIAAVIYAILGALTLRRRAAAA